MVDGRDLETVRQYLHDLERWEWQAVRSRLHIVLLFLVVVGLAAFWTAVGLFVIWLVVR